MEGSQPYGACQHYWQLTRLNGILYDSKDVAAYPMNQQYTFPVFPEEPLGTRHQYQAPSGAALVDNLFLQSLAALSTR